MNLDHYQLPDLSALETLILDRAPSFYGTPDAPDDEQALLDWANAEHVRYKDPSLWHMPVSNEHCEDTIYSSPVVNMAFRAWHDMLHLQHGQGFTLTGELEIARQHQLIGLTACLPDVLLRVLWFDTAGQNLYQFHHGEFPEDQQAFVKAALCVGLTGAINHGGF